MGEPEGGDALVAPENATTASADEGRLLCAVEGYEGFAPACSVERHYDANGLLLIVRLPDGGFRRLRVADGAVVAADGAEPAEVMPVGEGAVDVVIGDARVRLPDTILN
ncbi:hypothetical protein [Sphingomonas sp.]